jgi:ankyrin repeat protein
MKMDTEIQKLRRRFSISSENDAQLLKLIETPAKEAEFNVGKMQNLISAGANVNAKNTSGYSPLMIAVRDCRRNMITALVDIKGLLVNDTTPDGRTALIIAATLGDAFAITALLTVEGIVTNQADPKDTTPLMEAARLGHTDAVNALLADSRILASVNEIRQSDGYTALMLAIESGHTQTALRLLSIKGINIHTVALDGQTAISLASEYDNVKVIEQLIALGAVLPKPIKKSGSMEQVESKNKGKESRSESPAFPLLSPSPTMTFSRSVIAQAPAPLQNFCASKIEKLKKLCFG